MTGNLAMMMKLHDAQVADDVRKMAELGYFDVEFTMYGCVYMENGRRYYKVSPNASDIYTFIERSNLRGIFPSKVCTLTKSCAVPAGAKEAIAREVKVDLAREMAAQFPVEFFEQLEALAQAVTDDRAADFLREEAEALEGRFDVDAMERFETMVDYFYSCRRLRQETHAAFHGWLKEERKSMLENFISKDIFEKTVYGIYTRDGDKARYIDNARLDYVYEKMYAIEARGGLVTPVFAKTFWYNYRYRLADVMRDYKKALRETFDDEVLDALEALRCAGVYSASFTDALAQTAARFGEAAAETVRRYGGRWGVYRT